MKSSRNAATVRNRSSMWMKPDFFGRKCPKGHTYIHKEAKTMPGFKSFKDRVTLLLGGNVAGFKLKPFLIYRSENPRALKQVSKHTLPVYYRANNKAWMTQALFEDWFINCFIPSVNPSWWSNPSWFLEIVQHFTLHKEHWISLGGSDRKVYARHMEKMPETFRE